MSKRHRTLENPSAECPRTFIPEDGCPGTLISGGHPSLSQKTLQRSEMLGNISGKKRPGDCPKLKKNDEKYLFYSSWLKMTNDNIY